MDTVYNQRLLLISIQTGLVLFYIYLAKNNF